MDKIPEQMRSILYSRNPDTLEKAMDILYEGGFAYYSPHKNNCRKLEFLELQFHDKFDGLLGSNILIPFITEINYVNQVIKLKSGNEISFFFNENEEKQYLIPFPLKELEIFQNEIFLDEKGFRINHLDDVTKQELLKIIKRFDKAFYHDGDDLSFTHAIKHNIKTTNEIPIYTKLYRFPEIHRQEVNNQIEEMLQQCIIRNSDSPYSAPIWVAKKNWMHHKNKSGASIIPHN